MSHTMHRYAFACVVALLASLAATAQETPVVTNLLANGGFEETGADGWAARWEAWAREPREPGAVSLDGQVAFAGTHSLRLRHANDKSYTRGQQQITVQPGRRYAFTVRVKGEAITPQEPGWGARLWIDGPNASSSQAMAGTFDWTTLTVGPVSFGQATTVTVMCYLYQATGTVWFDEVTAFEVTPEWDKLQMQERCLEMLTRDLRLVCEAAQLAGDAAALAELDEIKALARREDMPTQIDCRAGMPYFPLQARVLGVMAQVNARKLPRGTRVAAWDMDPFERLPHIGMAPPALRPKPIEASLRLLMGLGEVEPGALVLCNVTDRALSVRVQVEGFGGQGGPQVVLREGVHVPRRGIVLGLDPLPRLQRDTMRLNPGLFRLLWLEVNSAGATPGVHAGTVRITSARGTEVAAPLRVEVLPVRFPAELPIVTWNYCYQVYPLTSGRWPQAVEDLARHHINGYAWLSDYLPWPKFDPQGALQPMDWLAFDEGLRTHGKIDWLLLETQFAREYNLKLHDETLELGSAEWERRFGLWFRALLSGLQERGFGTDRVAWYLADEPHTWEITNAVVTGGTIIKKVAPEALVMTNPYASTSWEMLQAMDPVVDIWCPQLTGVKEEWLDLFRQRGRALWSYQVLPADGDPFVSCRLSFWDCWIKGMTGQGFWAHGAGGGSIWNPYDGERHDYAVVYDGDPEELIPSRRWEGWREGVEDYTYLWMLREAVAQGQVEAARREAARELLSTRAKRVMAEGTRETLRDARADVLRALAASARGR